MLPLTSCLFINHFILLLYLSMEGGNLTKGVHFWSISSNNLVILVLSGHWLVSVSKPNFDVLPIVMPNRKFSCPLSFRNPFHYFSSLLANVHGFVIMLVVPKSLYISHAWRWAIYFHETYISAILPKEPTFEGVFYVFMGKKLCLFVHMVKVSKNRNVLSKVFYKNIFVFLP